MTLSPQEKLKMLEDMGVMPKRWNWDDYLRDWYFYTKDIHDSSKVNS